MKCDNCPALATEGYEYPETYCSVYGEDECIEFKDGSLGCRHKLATIEKRLEQIAEIEAHRWDGIEETYKAAQEQEDAVEKAIRYALDINSLVIAYKWEDGLYQIDMKGDIPSHLHDMVWRLIEGIENEGYKIIKREGEKNNDQ